MNIYLTSTLIVVFIFFVTIESSATVARYAGYKRGSIAIGNSLHNAILSLNRFLGFLVGPIIGFMSDTGANKYDLLILGLTCSCLGAISVYVTYWKWREIASYFGRIISHVKKNGYNLKVIYSLSPFGSSASEEKVKGFNHSYFWASLVTMGLVMPVPFVLNILAIEFIQYKATIIQFTGAVSGLGSLLLNFYTNPRLAVEEDRGAADECYRSIYIGKIFGLLVFSPMLILSAYIH